MYTIFLKKIVFRLFLLAGCALKVLPCHCQVVPELEAIPEKDRESLALFFEALMRIDAFGYTIFGDKPISATGCWTKYTASPVIFSREKVYRRGEELWGKYSSKFDVKNFVFKFEEIEDWYGVFLINKKSFIKVVEQHIDAFRKILGQHTTAEDLFLQLVNSENTFQEVLKENECLFGIIFGYGYTNACMYNRRREALQDLKAYFTPPLALPEQTDFLLDFCIKERRDYISHDYAQELLAEYYNLKKTLKGTYSDSGILDAYPEVGFWADPDNEETKRLLKQYNTTKIEIINAFLSGNFLEVVVCKMAED